MLIPLNKRPSHKSATIAALVSLTLMFLWVYGRFAFGLYFISDDFVEAVLEMNGPLWPTLRGVLDNTITFSGYRPLTGVMRVLMFHAFGVEHVWAYFAVYLSLHLINTLLAFRIVWRVAKSELWAFLAAAIFLLLPAHNEAVFWFAANSNVLALLFCLLALDFSLTAFERPAIGPQIGAVAAYICAVLTYEVTITLPALIFLADCIQNGRTVRNRLRFYAMFLVAIASLFALRMVVQGSLVAARGDYHANIAPSHILRGFALIFSQIVLLFNSPNLGSPLYAYSRNWLEPASLSALATIGLTVLLATAAFAISARTPAAPGTEDCPHRTRTALFWAIWGVLWILGIGFAFATLAGRNPENRYMYPLAFGFAVSVTALIAELYRRLRGHSVLQYSILALMACLLAFYAYVDVGDAHDWVSASAIVRSNQEAFKAAIPAIDADQTVSQIGFPSKVGSAYAYGFEGAFQDAMRLLYGTGRPGFSAHESLRAHLTRWPESAATTYLMRYSPESGPLAPIVAVILCTKADDCEEFKLKRPDGVSYNKGLRYVQIHNPERPDLGNIFMFATRNPPAIVECSFFQDWGVPFDDAALQEYSYAERCADAMDALVSFPN